MADEAPQIREEIKIRSFDMRRLWRICCWGGSAVIALTAVAALSQTQTGQKRIALAFGQVPPVATAQLLPSPAKDDAETRMLEEQVRVLGLDRDRLKARIALLERSLDDMTGSIKSQVAEAVAANAEVAPPPAAAPTPAISPVASVPVPAPAESAAVPLPPVRTATTARTEPTVAPTAPAKTEYGVDLGGATSVAALKNHWAGVKANFGPQLLGLRPAIITHERKPGNPEYRLIVGPVSSFGAATQLCAKLLTAHLMCRATKFTGEHLAQQ